MFVRLFDLAERKRESASERGLVTIERRRERPGPHINILGASIHVATIYFTNGDTFKSYCEV